MPIFLNSDDDAMWNTFRDFTLDLGVEDTAPAVISDDQRAQYEEVLTRVFGIDKFRENQLEAIAATMAGRDTFILMPTGGGKSLCYQLVAILQNEQTHHAFVTIVVAPLLSLIRDQARGLIALGVDAVELTPGSNSQAINARLRSDLRPALLFLTPERLQKDSTLYATLHFLNQNGHLARFVIDEAHCISTWGPEFRGDVRNSSH
ncbi:P-loop containing nucleoside triphosphate hydrolase protein [Mycena belliarum]|uniref:P-loop containing nucleoside triphosphate hydrolase protein n=1 Tax=Mycena belliarum TaxID=1033014 RepID=A0AAD6XQ03_9AGAR|nr:P-loop containing nucleoside triphosphate hydrolase protein [Mycena belliae]